MSYDLCFWADTRPERPAPGTVHDQLAAGDRVEGIDAFDAPGTLGALRGLLPGLTFSGEPHGNAAWQDPDAQTVFEFDWSPQLLTVTARGNYSNDQMNAIIDAAVDVGGGRLYDPQVGERFD